MKKRTQQDATEPLGNESHNVASPLSPGLTGLRSFRLELPDWFVALAEVFALTILSSSLYLLGVPIELIVLTLLATCTLVCARAVLDGFRVQRKLRLMLDSSS